MAQDYMQTMGQMQKANALGGVANSALSGDVGGALSNLINYAALRKMINQNQGGFAGGATNSGTSSAANTASKLYAQNDIALDGSLDKMVKSGTGDVAGLKSALQTEGNLNAKQAQSVVSAGISNLENGEGLDGMAQGAESRLSQFAKQDTTGGVVNNVASKLGLSTGELATGLGIAGAGAGLLGLAGAAQADSTNKQNTEANNQAAAQTAGDTAALQKASDQANNISDAYNGAAANAALTVGIANANSGMINSAQSLQQSNQQREMARQAAQNQQAIQKQLGNGSVLNGILSEIPGTQQNALMKQSAANQSQLAQQGIITSGINPYVGGSAQNINMSGLSSMANYGTQGF